MPARDRCQRNFASSAFPSTGFREIGLLETGGDRLLDFGAEMMLRGGHASVAGKRWEGNARVEIGIIEQVEDLLADVAVEMMFMVEHVSGADTRWEGHMRVEMARARSFNGRSFKTAVTQKARIWSDRPVGRSLTSILISWETWVTCSIGRDAKFECSVDYLAP
jgi:hypothetical protein